MGHMPTDSQTPDITKTYTVSRRHSDTLGVNMGRTNFRGAIAAYEELVANCVDGGAKVVKISIDRSYNGEGGRGRTTIGDDGHGMKDGEGIQAFYDIGGSEKREMKERGELTPEGRTPIGSFGWGTLATRYLGTVCTLESWKGETYTTIREVFTPDDKDTDEHEAGEGVYTGNKQGTRTTLTGLKFLSNEDAFTDNELRAALEDNIDVEGLGVSIYVNGTLVEPFVVKNPTRYQVEFEVPDVGTVKGIINYHNILMNNLKDIINYLILIKERCL